MKCVVLLTVCATPLRRMGSNRPVPDSPFHPLATARKRLLNAMLFPNKATDSPVLLVVDVQEGFNQPDWGARSTPNAEVHIGRLLRRWRANDWPVVYAQQLLPGRFRRVIMRQQHLQPGGDEAVGHRVQALRHLDVMGAHLVQPAVFVGDEGEVHDGGPVVMLCGGGAQAPGSAADLRHL